MYLSPLNKKFCPQCSNTLLRCGITKSGHTKIEKLRCMKCGFTNTPLKV